MSNNFTITLSLGSGPDAEALASKIKRWAGTEPVSKAIRNLILSHFNTMETGPTGMGPKTHSVKHNK